MRVLWLLLILVPAAQAGIVNPDEAHDARLYLHLDGLQDIRLNPLAPPEEAVEERGADGLTHSSCLDTPGQSLTSQQLHTWYAVVSPDRVRYREGEPVAAAPRGIQDDLRLAEGPMMLTWHMRPGSPAQEGAAVQVVLRTTIREGDDISVDDEAFNVGRIVAEGETEPADLTPALDGHPHVRYDDEHSIYTFSLPLTPRGEPTISQAESFNVRIEVATEEPYCRTQDQYTMPDSVRVVSTSTHRPTLDLSLHAPVRIDRFSAVVEDGMVAFQADVRGVFGAADLRLMDAPMVIQGPDDAVTVSRTSWGAGAEEAGRVFPDQHRGSYQASAQWAYGADEAPSGLYNATLRIETETGAVAVATVPFGLGSERQTCTVLATGEPTCSVAPSGDKASPVGWVPAALVAAALWRRRVDI